MREMSLVFAWWDRDMRKLLRTGYTSQQLNYIPSKFKTSKYPSVIWKLT
jgi:hypothetical protein